MSSFIVKTIFVVESLLTILCIDDERVLILLFNNASVDKIREEDRCIFVLFSLLAGLLESLSGSSEFHLHLIKPSKLGPDLVLLLELFVLYLSDLSLGSSSLCPHLKHVDTNAMKDYMNK